MRRFLRTLLALTAAFVVTLVLFFSATALVLRSNWFKERARQQIITSVEQATGGRAELSSVDFDWPKLSFRLRNFVLHGSEPSAAKPLFESNSILIGLKISSFFARNVDVSALVVSHPELHLLVRQDGSTNIPVPRLRPMTLADGIHALLDLKVRRFELNDGELDMQARRIPLNIHGESTSVLLTYNRPEQRYGATLSASAIHFAVAGLEPFSAAINAMGSLERDDLIVQTASLQGDGFALTANAAVRHFLRPTVDMQVAGHVGASTIARLAKLSNLQSGTLLLDANGHFDADSPFTIHGRLGGRDILYRLPSIGSTPMRFDTDLFASPQLLELTHTTLFALGGRVAGELTVRNGRDLRVDGAISGMDSQRILKAFSVDWPLSGVVSGPVHLTANPAAGWRDLVLRSDLQLVPGSAPSSAPVSGFVGFVYQRPNNAFEFSESHLDLPNTHVSFSGTLGTNVALSIDTSNLNEIQAALPPNLRFPVNAGRLPSLLEHGAAHFDGTVAGALSNPQISGNLRLANFRVGGASWDQFRTGIVISSSILQLSSAVLDQTSFHVAANAEIGLHNWASAGDTPIKLDSQFSGADVAQIIALSRTVFKTNLPEVNGVASGTLELHGTTLKPYGSANVNLTNVAAFGEAVGRVELAAGFAGNQLNISRGLMRAGSARLRFSGTYTHANESWQQGKVDFNLDSNGFPLAAIAPLQAYNPALRAELEVHGSGAMQVRQGRLEPLTLKGTAAFRNISLNDLSYGSVTINAETQGPSILTTLSGNLRGSRVTGSAQIKLVAENTIRGQLHLDRIQLSTIGDLLNPGGNLPGEGFLQGDLTFDGALNHFEQMHGRVRVQELQLSPKLSAQNQHPDQDQAETKALVFRNVGPMVVDYAHGVADVKEFHLGANGSVLSLSGSIPYLRQEAIDLKAVGLVDLGILQLFNADLRSAGESTLLASIGGTLANPMVNGSLNLKDGSLFLANFPNGLTAVNGNVRFDRNRATIERLTAQTGGGQLDVGGFVSFANGGPLVYRLEANAQNVRIRYAGSLSVTATSNLRLTGTSRSSVLSGTATISRVVFNPNTDIGNLLASAAVPASTSEDTGFTQGLQLDVHVESAQSLQLSTSLSRDVEAEIDLRLRGTPARPILLGSISANQGDIKVFGTKYSINRGEISFSNAAKIVPVLDMDLQTQARGITVDITISGTPGKFNINYRSDPPLQPRDIIALLTVGRAPDIASNVPNAQLTNDVSALQSGANTVLGQAISPVSNRLSKLFGITNIKIDPLVQGITNTPQARLTVEQSISKQITVTYITNLAQTSEQIFRLEWAFSAQYSLIAIRDDNGEFGIDIQYKKRFK